MAFASSAIFNKHLGATVMDMKSLIPIIVAGVAAAYVCYVTVKGYRTGVLNLRNRFERRKSPRMYWLVLFLATVLSLVSVAAVALMVYGEAHPEWRRTHAKHAGRLRQEAAYRTTDYVSSTTWRRLPSHAC
jgi:H+/Cl- antiporter ClcA